MKKILFCMIGAALVAGCSKTETENTLPDNPANDYTPQTEYVEIGVSTNDDDTKATYDASLKAYWEAGDQILGVQGSATSTNSEVGGGKTYTANGQTLSLQSGENTNAGRFAGEITEHDDRSRYYHFAYPASAQLITTTNTRGLSGLSGSFSTTTTCTFTVPAKQDGKWTPFFCTSTADKVAVANIKNVTFGKSLNAALGIRVFASDKTTPKKLASITIVAENNITGTLSATTDNDGSFSGKAFVANATGNTITAENPQYTEGTDKNGRTYYEYRFEVLPVSAGAITITLTDEDGSMVERKTSAKTFTANYRSGVNVVWDAATISMDKPTSWYEDASADSSLSGNTVYVNNIVIGGAVASKVAEMGVYIKKDNEAVFTKYNLASGVLSVLADNISASAGSGVYIVYPYAKIDGEAEEIVGGEQTVVVTDKLAIASHTIRSSYNSNATVAKNNSLSGSKIYARASLNDAYAQSNLVQSVTLRYGNASVVGTINSEFSTADLAWKSYPDCYVEVVMKNGLTYTTDAYTINVTGIPYKIDSFSSIPSGWSQNNTASWQSNVRFNTTDAYAITPKFYVPNSSIDVKASIQAYAYGGSLYGNYKPNVYISASASGKSGGSATQLSGSNLFPGQASYTKIDRDITLDSVSNICIYTSGKKGSSITIGTNGVCVKSVFITY